MRGADGLGPAGGGAGPLPVGQDLTGTTAAATVVAVQGQAWSATPPVLGDTPVWDGAVWVPTAVAEYTATYWVDPNGDPTSNGLASSKPTTLAAALAIATSGSRIILSAGTYAGVTISTDGLALVGAAQSTASASASVRFTSLVTVNGLNCHFSGLQFGALTDASGVGGTGTTVLEQCSLQGTLTVSNANGTTVSLMSCSFADITCASGVSGTVRIKLCSSGGTITNASTALLITIAEESTFTAITQTDAGGQAIELRRCILSGGITRLAGDTTAVNLYHSILGSTIDATGALAGTVRIVSSVFTRAGSSVPVGAEAGVVTRDTALEYSPTATIDWAIAPPALVATALDKLAKGESAYGARPWFWRDEDVVTSVTVGPAPTFTGSVSYLTSGGNVDFAPGVYLGLVTAFFSVTASTTAVYWDLWAGGAPSSTGFAAFPIGLADAADTRTAGVIIYLPFGASLPFDLRFGRYSGPGSVTLQNAGFLFIRIGNVP